MNDDTKQFIANGIALKFGEMATSLVKTMKFQPNSPGFPGYDDLDRIQNPPSEPVTVKTSEQLQQEFDDALSEWKQIDKDIPLDDPNYDEVKAVERRVLKADEVLTESQGATGTYPQPESALLRGEIDQAPGGFDLPAEGLTWDQHESYEMAVTQWRSGGSEGPSPNPAEFATEGGGEGGEGGDAAQWMQNAVQDFAKKNNLEGASGDEIYEAIQEAGEHHGMMEDYANAGHVAMPEGQTWDDLDGDEYGEFIDAVEGDIIEAADVVSGTPGAGGGEAAQDEPKKKSTRCETGTRKDPKTGQCKPHQARQAMNDNVKMYIANGIAMRFGQVAANFVKTMKFQPSYQVGTDYPDDAKGRQLHDTLADAGEIYIQTVQENESSHIQDQAYDDLEYAISAYEDVHGSDAKPGGFHDSMLALRDEDPEQGVIAEAQRHLDNTKTKQAEADPRDAGPLPEPDPNDPGGRSPGYTPGEYPVVDHTKGGDTGVEGGGEWPGGPGGGGPKRDQYEWEQDSQGSVTITDTTTGASAFIQVGSDGLSELKAELKNAPDEHSQQLIMDQYSTIMDPPEGGGGAEGEAEEKKSRSDRCETGTHKDPKTGQCKPI